MPKQLELIVQNFWTSVICIQYYDHPKIRPRFGSPKRGLNIRIYYVFVDISI